MAREKVTLSKKLLLVFNCFTNKNVMYVYGQRGQVQSLTVCCLSHFCVYE